MEMKANLLGLKQVNVEQGTLMLPMVRLCLTFLLLMACSRPALVWVFSSSRVEAAAADNLEREEGRERGREGGRKEWREGGRNHPS